MGSSRCVAVVGTALIALGTVSCSGSSTKSASTSTTIPVRSPVTTQRQALAFDHRKYQAVVTKDPADKFGWYNLGVVAQQTGKDNQAEAYVLKALVLDHKFEAALYFEGVMRYRAHDGSDAVTYLRRAVAENPNDANAHWELGLALSVFKDPRTAAEGARQLHEALKLDPSLAKATAAPDGLEP